MYVVFLVEDPAGLNNKGSIVGSVHVDERLVVDPPEPSSPFAKSPFQNKQFFGFANDAASREYVEGSGLWKLVAALFFGCGCSSTTKSSLALSSHWIGLSEITFAKGLFADLNTVKPMFAVGISINILPAISG